MIVRNASFGPCVQDNHVGFFHFVYYCIIMSIRDKNPPHYVKRMYVHLTWYVVENT